MRCSAEAFGYGWSDFEWLTINAMKSAFAHFDERLQIINTVIKPGFATARAASNAVVRVPGRGRRGVREHRPPVKGVREHQDAGEGSDG